MSKNRLIVPVAAAAAMLAFTGVAVADVAATATLDLNIRSGPGPQFPVIGVIEADSAVALSGCLETGTWCSVNYDGTEGWAYSGYLVAEQAGPPVVITEQRAEIEAPVVEYDGPEEGMTVGAIGGAVAGALVAGPVGAVVGGIAGASTGVAVDPPTEVETYVISNELEPVYLDGEIVVGAGVPETVELYPVPDFEYSYAYINERPVLVDPGSRRIVYIVRG
jgi:uncharacterized protein YraI